MRRRSMPGSYSESASKSVPSPRIRRATMPDWASRRNSWSAVLRVGVRLGRMPIGASIGRVAWRQASPSGPCQRSHTASTKAVPRRVGRASSLVLHALASRKSGATSRPPGARRGSSASAAQGAAFGASPVKSASTERAIGAPTSPTLGTITRKSTKAGASRASSNTMTSSAAPSAGAATHAPGAAAATISASGAASASSTAARVDG